MPRDPGKIATLEGLRAFAVGLVIVAHTTPWHIKGLDFFRWWDPGAAGVRLFFVLSGFLITGILLRAREASDQRGHILWAFYARRALRILPLAYLALAVAVLWDFPGARARWPWYAGYAINVEIAWTGERNVALSHLWSLAVEEQFYLIWPWLVLWTPRSALGRVLGVMIGAAVVTRFGLLLAGQPLAAYMLMPARLDALAAGALLAVWAESGRRPPASGWAAGAVCVAAGAFAPAGPFANSAMETGMVIMSLMTVDRLRRLSRGVLWRVATNPVAQYLGAISYGLYVWHPMVRRLALSFGHHAGVSIPFPAEFGWRQLGYVGIGTIVAATLSWHLLERPLNDLKRWFPYVGRRHE